MVKITFTDENDNVLGSGTKEDVWKKGIWHRVVRVYLINSKGEVLITRRAASLVSCPGKWNDSASGHVDEGETYQQAALRELNEEVGISGIYLRKISKIKCSETDESEKIKNRFTTIFTGQYDGEVNFNPSEVEQIRWVHLRELKDLVKEQSGDFTEGFKNGLALIQ
ncbi:hypothetical protein COB18_00475 [Candidatus Kaiserbacteria bacterium]|nr:MAG: hypothetical protein COB18_00475 [Candidatus Kaiserbacteria bacterium]